MLCNTAVQMMWGFSNSSFSRDLAGKRRKNLQLQGVPDVPCTC